MAWTVELESDEAVASGGKNNRTRKYIVQSDTVTTALAALGATGIPAQGTFEGTLVVKAVKATHKSRGLVFDVVVETTDDYKFGQKMLNPLDRDNRVVWTQTDKLEPFFKDVNGLVTVNSAGEAFETLIERESGELQCTVTVNQATFDVDDAIDFLHVVNSGTFNISDGHTTWVIPADVAKMGAISSSALQVENETEFYEVTYPIKFRRDGWNVVVLDMGRNEIAGGGCNRLTPIYDCENKPVRMPWPLDGAGGKKANPNDVPNDLTFVAYESESFSGLPLS